MSEDTKQAMPKPTVWDEMFPGRFLKAGLLKGKDVTLRIAAVDVERLPNDKGVEETRGVLTFEKTDKQLALNKTNGLCLKAMFGAEVQKWVGQRVTLYPTTDRFGRDIVEAIRVRGSPDIAADVTVKIKLPKKAEKIVTLVKMVAKGAQQQPPADSAKPSESDGPP